MSIFRKSTKSTQHIQIEYVLQSNDNHTLYIWEDLPFSKGSSESSECDLIEFLRKHSPHA